MDASGGPKGRWFGFRLASPPNEKEVKLTEKPDANPKPPGPKPPIYMQLYS